MKPKQRMKAVVDALKVAYPEARCSLEYGGEPWKLMVMGRLSAQCTDARVNIVCRELFERYPTAQALADGELSEIEEIIRPCGLFRTKASDIKAECKRLCELHGGVLPDSVGTLMTFPGIGSKIANLLVGDIYKKGGVVTDTHCIRICGRLGFYPETLKDPRRIERILTELIRVEEQSDFCHRLVLFGRDVCRARGENCEECCLSEFCKHYKSTHKHSKKQ